MVRVARGMTLVELLLVISIMLILTLGLGAGYARLSAGNKVSTAIQRINSALHLARNLAISNHRIYHVRIETVDTLDSVMPDPAWVDDPNNPNDKPPLIPNPNALKVINPQYVSIYCFNNMSDALQVKSQMKPEDPTATATINNWWNVSNNPNPVPNMPPNRAISRDQLPSGVFAGIQYGITDGNSPYKLKNFYFKPLQDPNDPVRNPFFEVQFEAANTDHPDRPYDWVISFNPDGTASRNMLFFATDCREMADDMSMARENEAKFLAVQAERLKLGFHGSIRDATTGKMLKGFVQYIQVFNGGLIREVQTIDIEEIWAAAPPPAG